MKTEDALAGDWRRADEETGGETPGDDDGLGLGRGCSQLHENDGGCNRRDGHRRVHDDAKLAVIGVGRVGVQVRDLRKGEQGKQEEAQTRNNRREIEPAAVPPAEKCLKCRQILTSTLLLYKRTHFF
jgi:hypothetical protein